MKKKTHGVQLLIRAVVKDPDGKVLSDTGQKPAKSLVIAFLKFVSCLLGEYTEARSVSDDVMPIYTGGYDCSETFRANAGVTTSSWGIVVGTNDGPTAEDNENFVLDTQLTHGVGPGNITYGAMVVGVPAVVGANVDTELIRAFTNNTGVAIDVKEAGIYVFSNLFTPRTFLIIRDVFGAIEVPDKCSLAIHYTLRTTV